MPDERPISEDDPAYTYVLQQMAAAIGAGNPAVRTCETSGQPVFSDATEAARLNPEGAGLSRKLSIARAQLGAAGLDLL